MEWLLKKTFNYEEQDEVEVEKFKQIIDCIDKFIYIDESGTQYNSRLRLVTQRK